MYKYTLEHCTECATFVFIVAITSYETTYFADIACCFVRIDFLYF